MTAHEQRSKAELMASLNETERRQILAKYNDAELAALLYDWHFWGRPNQLWPGGDWHTWLLLAGRGFGKTRTGAETVRERIMAGQAARVGLIAPTAADARDVMIEGESGLVNIFPPHQRPHYESSKRRVVFHNGAVAFLYSAEEPDRLRGPQHDFLWGDEVASWRYPETWDMAKLGLRLGKDPRAVVTTTPKPVPLIKAMLSDGGVCITKGSTFDNRGNLPEAFMAQIRDRYEGTRLGRQELYAELLDDNPNALWNRGDIEKARVVQRPELVRIVVGVDPAVTSGANSDEAGIITAGKDAAGNYYVLDDHSMKASPTAWAKAAVTAYHKHAADRVIGEANNGGDMIEIVLRTIDPGISYKKVHASKGKHTRAEPVAALYEQGKVHHVGTFAALEDELCEWTPGDASPNRLDALVWAISELNRDGGSWGWQV